MLQDEQEYLICTPNSKNELPNQLLNILLNQFNVVAWKLDIKEKLIYPNDKTRKIFGNDFTPRVIPDSLIDSGIYHPDSINAFFNMYKKLFVGNTNVSCEGKVKMVDGKYHWLRVKYVLFFDEHKVPYQAIGFYHDITADKEMQDRYRQVKIFRSLFTVDTVIAYEVDLDDNVIIAFDQGYLDTNAKIGSSFYAFIQEVTDNFVHPDFKNDFSQNLSRDNLIAAFKQGKTKMNYEFLSNENGIEYRWLRKTVRLFRNVDTNHICAFLYVNNIDKEKKEELALRKAASRDPLTGLHNRNSFEQLVNQYIQADKSKEKMAAFIMLDVDDFKRINDTYGHVFGDKVLCLFANKISEIFRTDDIISRLGGDEFVIFLKNINSSEVALKAAQKLCLGMRSWNLMENNYFEASCSVGIALYPIHGENFISLYKKADEAQYDAKKNGKNHSSMYENY